MKHPCHPSVKVNVHQLSTLARVCHQPVTRSGFPSGQFPEIGNFAGISDPAGDDSTTHSGFRSAASVLTSNPTVFFLTGLAGATAPVHASHFLLGARL